VIYFTVFNNQYLSRLGEHYKGEKNRLNRCLVSIIYAALVKAEI